MAIKPKLGEGGRFKALAGKVEEQYESKGIKPEKAKEIAAKVAASAGIKKYGKAKMAKLAIKGKFTPRSKGEKNAASYL